MEGKTKTAWVAWRNTDLTEGRGFDYPWVVCESETTARRLGAGKDVQGSSCRVEAVKLVRVDGHWYGPVKVETATENDLQADQRRAAFYAAFEKAREAGLTDDDLEILKKGL